MDWLYILFLSIMIGYLCSGVAGNGPKNWETKFIIMFIISIIVGFKFFPHLFSSF